MSGYNIGKAEPKITNESNGNVKLHRSHEQLRRQIEPLRIYVGQKLQHVKSGDWYRVTGFHFRESTMTIEFTYETMTPEEPISFCRPIAELFDSRFAF